MHYKCQSLYNTEVGHYCLYEKRRIAIVEFCGNSTDFRKQVVGCIV